MSKDNKQNLFSLLEKESFAVRVTRSLTEELGQLARNPTRLLGGPPAPTNSQVLIDSEPLLKRVTASLGELVKNPTKLLSSPPAPKGGTVLLESEPLLSRVSRSIVEAFADFGRDPKAFIVNIFRSDPLEAKRKMYYRMGLSMSIFLWLLGSIIYIGYYFYKPEPPKADEDELQKIADLTLLTPPELKAPPAQQRASGGGGGGRREMTPPSKGVPPKADLRPPIVAPSTHPPKIEKPSLPVIPTVQVQPELVPQQQAMNIPLGDPKGIPGPPSDGPGEGNGIGTGKGGGVGSGRGTGLGPGEGFNTGGGSPGIGGGDGIYAAGKDGVRSPQILSKTKPKYTEDARRDKIQGVVVLSAVFRKDGTISDIKVIRGLGYGLDEEAVKAAAMIKFIPGTKDGVPVNVRARLEFTFSLL